MSRRIVVGMAVLTGALQLWRVFCGVDFNDEMQYYGELLSLIENDRLFSNDLFLQQNVYLLLYPVLKPYVLFAGRSGLIVVVRLLLAAFIVTVAHRTFRCLSLAGVGPVAAAIGGFAVTFAVPVAGIYSVSYNSVALGLLTLCFAEFLVWRHDGRPPRLGFWVPVLLVLLLVYPPLGLSVSVLVATRLLMERDWPRLVRALLYGAAGAMALSVVYFSFATFHDLREALAFSRAFGVAQMFLQQPRLMVIWLAALVATPVGLLLARRGVFSAWLARGHVGRIAAVTLVLVTCVACLGVLRTESCLSALALVLLALAVLVPWLEPSRFPGVNWQVALCLLAGTTMSVTSGVGFPHIQWPLMAAAPLVIGQAWSQLSRVPDDMRSAWRGLTFAVTAGILCVWTAVFLLHPYQDLPIFASRETVSGAPAFALLRVHRAKAAAIGAARALFADVPAGRSTMVVGAQPWLYLALDVRHDTDMVFMHPYSAIEGQEQLGQRLLRRRPDTVVVAAPASPPVERAAQQLIASAGYVCESRSIPPALANAPSQIQTYLEFLPQAQVCKRTLAAHSGTSGHDADVPAEVAQRRHQ